MWVKCSYPKGKTASLITRISPSKNQFPYCITTIDHRFLTLFHGDPRCITVSVNQGCAVLIEPAVLASGFICALVLVVDSLARRSTYDRAPDQLTSALLITVDPAVRYGGPWDPAVRFWGFEATTTYSHQ